MGRTDDLIGRKTLTFTPEELLAAMPSVGDTVEENFLLGPCVAPFVCRRKLSATAWKLRRRKVAIVS